MRQLQAELVLDELLRVLKTTRSHLRGPSWTPLTRHLFSCLYRLGRDAGYKVWDRKHGGEYIWDIVWSYELEPARRYWLELVGEIELADSDTNSLIDDFYKVLDAKARLKVFVGAPPTRRALKGICDAIDWAISHQRFRLREERFIAIVLDYDGRKDTYLHRVRLFDGSRPVGKWRSEWEKVKFPA